MSYHPIGGAAEHWTRDQVLAYMRKWSARGRSQKAIRNYLIAEDVCQSPGFKRQCAERLNAAYRVATAMPLPPMPRRGDDAGAPDGAAMIPGIGTLRRFAPYVAVAGVGLVGLIYLLRRKT